MIFHRIMQKHTLILKIEKCPKTVFHYINFNIFVFAMIINFGKKIILVIILYLYLFLPYL